MGRRKDLSPKTKGIAVGLASAGCSYQNIATKLKISKSAVGKAVKSYRESTPTSGRVNCGRKRTYGRRVINRIHHAVTTDPFQSSSQIAANLRIGSEISPSASTVRRILVNDLNLRARKAAKKPRLTKVQRRKRLEFCRQHAHWTAEQWREVLFSDESTGRQFSSSDRYVRRPVGMRYSPRYTIPTVKHSLSVMVWGCFGAQGIGDLWFMPPGVTMDGATYSMVLEFCLSGSAERLECSTFQQDGAPCHRIARVAEIVQEAGLTLLPWPGNSPDLNPIENLWDIVKDRVAQLKPSSFSGLCDSIHAAWTQTVSPELCATLVDSMPRRIAAVIAAKGDSTKY